MSEKYRDYEHDSGRKSRVRIEKIRKLGEGDAADVYSVKARDQSGERKKEVHSLVIKKYKKRSLEGEAQEMAEKSLENYALLKRLGFPVPPTYRLDKENSTILMTNMSALQPNTVSVTSSESTEIEGRFIRNIYNFEELVEELIKYAGLATAHRIRIGADAYNVTIPRSGEGYANLYITDLEGITNISEKDSGLGNLLEIEKGNMDDALLFLYTFLVAWRVPNELQSRYFSTLARTFLPKMEKTGTSMANLKGELEKYI